jgi:hypothetical protein
MVPRNRTGGVAMAGHDRRLREDEQFHRISDDLMDEIELRFSLLTEGTVRRSKQG